MQLIGGSPEVGRCHWRIGDPQCPADESCEAEHGDKQDGAHGQDHQQERSVAEGGFEVIGPEVLEGAEKCQCPDGQEGAVGQFAFLSQEPVGECEDDGHQRCDEEDHDHRLPADEAADGGHQCHVAEPHRLLFQHPVTGDSDQPDDSATDNQPGRADGQAVQVWPIGDVCRDSRSVADHKQPRGHRVGVTHEVVEESLNAVGDLEPEGEDVDTSEAGRGESGEHGWHGDAVGDHLEIEVNQRGDDESFEQDHVVEVAEVQDCFGREPGGSLCGPGEWQWAEVTGEEATGAGERPAEWAGVADFDQVHHHPQHPVEELDQRVSGRDRLSTISASASEFQPAEDRDIIGQPDRTEAAWAVGGRMEQAFPAVGDGVVSWQAVDTDVQEAADDAAQHEDREQDEPDGQATEHHDQFSWRPSMSSTAATPSAATSSIVRPLVSIVNVWQLRYCSTRWASTAVISSSTLLEVNAGRRWVVV